VEVPPLPRTSLSADQESDLVLPKDGAEEMGGHPWNRPTGAKFYIAGARLNGRRLDVGTSTNEVVTRQ